MSNLLARRQFIRCLAVSPLFAGLSPSGLLAHTKAPAMGQMGTPTLKDIDRNRIGRHPA